MSPLPPLPPPPLPPLPAAGIDSVDALRTALAERVTSAWSAAPPPPPRSADLFMILFVSVFLFITATLLRLVPWVSPLHPPPRWRDASEADALRAFRHFSPYGTLDPSVEQAGRAGAPSYETLLEIGERIGSAKGGLNEEQIGVLETYVCKDNEGEQSRRGGKCAICRDMHREADVICVLPCGDEYHAECISPWLRQQATCPLCRCRFA